MEVGGEGGRGSFFEIQLLYIHWLPFSVLAKRRFDLSNFLICIFALSRPLVFL